MPLQAASDCFSPLSRPWARCVHTVDAKIDTDLQQKKDLNFTSLTDEACTSKASTVVNNDWELLLLSGDEISLFQSNLEDVERPFCFFIPLLFKLLKSTLVHRPSLKCLCHLYPLKKGFVFSAGFLCWSFAQRWFSAPPEVFCQP